MAVLRYIARWEQGSTVFVFQDLRGNGYTCLSCCLKEGSPSQDELAGHPRPEGCFHTEGPEEMLEHLKQHEAAGHKILPSSYKLLTQLITGEIT